MQDPYYPRSSRKRKAIDYAALAGDKPDWEDEYPTKGPKTQANKIATKERAVLGSYRPKEYEQALPSKGAAHPTVIGMQGYEELSPSKKSPKKKARRADDGEEKRARRYRPKAPQSYRDIKERALTQRFYVINRERCGTEDVPEEKVILAGTTGNVYEQQICKVPSCSCPHAQKGNQCKHLIYLMLRVYKVREEIGYQLALLSSELREIFKDAPIPSATPTSPDSSDPRRKPIEGDCPICYSELESGSEKIVYCKEGCGNNIHRDCMNNWARAKEGEATCPYCRAKWAGEELVTGVTLDMLNGATKSREGYVNVASQLGLSGRRDYSTYHRPWVSRQRAAFAIDDEEDYYDDY